LVDPARFESFRGELRHRLKISIRNTSTKLPNPSRFLLYTMAARITVGQVPAMFARRQPKVFGISKREFPVHRSNILSAKESHSPLGWIL
jgi:hypothetical protein